MTMWATQEYCNRQISGLRSRAIVGSAAGERLLRVNPSSVNAGQSSQTITINGQSGNGSGFYDPGVGFANRPQVSISGGVAVQAVNYVNPTTITVIINTTNATAGTHLIVITNPDGQQVSASALTVKAASLTGATGPTGATGIMAHRGLLE